MNKPAMSEATKQPEAESGTSLDKLTDAIKWVKENYPLPRCSHGKPLKDGSFELLEPSCGCRGYNLDPDFRREPPDSGDYCVRCQKRIANRKKAVSVTVHWPTWTVIAGGDELIGSDCWAAIRKAKGGTR